MQIKIIVIDDNAITNRIIHNIIKNDFKDKDIVVEFFTDGKSGLSYLMNPENIPDYHVVILDGHLKAKDGDEQIDGPFIAEKLTKITPDKPVIVYTSDKDLARKMCSFFNPPPPCLPKQLSRETLKKVISEQILVVEKKANDIARNYDAAR